MTEQINARRDRHKAFPRGPFKPAKNLGTAGLPQRSRPPLSFRCLMGFHVDHLEHQFLQDTHLPVFTYRVCERCGSTRMAG